MKQKYCVTVARVGCIFVEAESPEDAIEIADHQTTDAVRWSDDWSVTDCIPDDTEPNGVYVSEKSFD